MSAAPTRFPPLIANRADGTRHPRLDVEFLPCTALDHRSPIWWGNTLLLFIETTMFGVIVATYFYVRLNFEAWPPPQSEHSHANLNPLPSLPIATANLLLMLASLVPAAIVDRSALHRKTRRVEIGLLVLLAMAFGSITLRAYEFPALNVRWNDNAYASTAWTILGLHLTHFIVATAEMGLMAAWLFRCGMDDKHARDIRVTAIYWYWIVGIWVPLYLIVYFAPRLL